MALDVKAALEQARSQRIRPNHQDKILEWLESCFVQRKMFMVAGGKSQTQDNTVGVSQSSI